MDCDHNQDENCEQAPALVFEACMSCYKVQTCVWFERLELGRKMHRFAAYLNSASEGDYMIGESATSNPH